MPHKISINCSIFSLVYFLDAENEGKLINLRKVGLIYLFEAHLNSIAWSRSHCDFKVPVVPVQCFWISEDFQLTIPDILWFLESILDGALLMQLQCPLTYVKSCLINLGIFMH